MLGNQRKVRMQGQFERQADSGRIDATRLKPRISNSPALCSRPLQSFFNAHPGFSLATPPRIAAQRRPRLPRAACECGRAILPGEAPKLAPSALPVPKPTRSLTSGHSINLDTSRSWALTPSSSSTARFWANPRSTRCHSMLRLLSARDTSSLPSLPTNLHAPFRARFPPGTRPPRNTRVTVSELTDSEIAAYVVSRVSQWTKPAPMPSKAKPRAGYQELKGVISNVVGLPISLVYRMLREAHEG